MLDFGVLKCSCFLSSGFVKRRIPMCRWNLPFRDFSGALGFTPRVPSRWTVLVVSRFRDLRLQIPCQLRTPIAEMSMVSSMSATCPNKWTTVILLLFRESRFHEFRTLVASVFQNCELRNADEVMAWICCHLSSEMDGSQVLSGFRDIVYRSFWSAIAFAHPTLDYRFCDGIGSRHVSLDGWSR
jgi:hypothetical protein